jgi:uncharacterized membrane protein
MSASAFIIAYLAALCSFLAADALWLGWIAKSFYFTQLRPYLADPMRYGIAVIFYMIYATGIVFFAVRPAWLEGGLKIALLYGAFFGFFCYATYNFTNLATIKDWPISVVIVDLLWGCCVSALMAGCGWTALFSLRHLKIY